MTASHDLIVLGAGSAGLATALRAAQHGARVALLDPAPLGGTCVHRGCIPKKVLWYAAQWAQAQQSARQIGFAQPPGSLDWAAFRELRQRYIDAIEQRYAQRLLDAGVQRLHQAGCFASADTLELSDGSRLRARRIVIATGARPRRLPLPGFELGMVSDDMFALTRQPRRVAIVGGGYVAVEFAGLLQALGSQAELMTRGRLLESFDAEVVEVLAGQMQAHGTRIHHQSAIRSVRRDPEGLVLEDAQAGACGPYDALLWAVGRVPNTEALGLEEIGVPLDANGHVLTDAQQNTQLAGVFAVGDVAARKALTPVAVAAGRHLADRLFGGMPDAQLDYRNIPSVVFAEPPLGTLGLTEAEARTAYGEQVTIHRSRFVPMQWSLAGRNDTCLMKLVCIGPDERVVGIHALGPGVEEMLQGFAVAIRLGLHKRDLDATVAIHPTVSEELVLMD